MASPRLFMSLPLRALAATGLLALALVTPSLPQGTAPGTAGASPAQVGTAGANSGAPGAIVMPSGDAAAAGSAPPPTDTAQASALSGPAPASSAAASSLPKKPVVFRGRAPLGTVVRVDTAASPVDSAGRWQAVLQLDSVQKAASRFPLCLEDPKRPGYRACSEVSTRGFDTLELAPLAFVPDAVPDSAALDSARRADRAFTADSLAADSLARTRDREEVARRAVVVTEGGAGRTVTVRGRRRPPRMVGQQRVTAQQIKRLPGLAEPDVIRAVQALPGVVASSDFSTKIYVRGGGSDQNLFLFDDAVVYSPVHLFGLFSTFLVSGIDEVDFYKGGFPPEYGNRLSSVLDISSRRGGSDTVDTWLKGSSVMISTFAAQASVEGHQGPVRWVLGGRSTYLKSVLEALRSLDLTDLNLDYYFYDTQGNLEYAFSPETKAVLSFYHGEDKLQFTPFQVDWGNTVVPFNFETRLSKNTTLRQHLSYSNFEQSFGLANLFSFENSIRNYTYRGSAEYAGILNHRLEVGVEAGYYEVLFGNAQQAARIDYEDAPDFILASLYGQDRWRFGKNEFTLGVRGNYYDALERVSAEPRLTYKYNLDRTKTLNWHLGYYEQFINSVIFADFESTNEFYYPARVTARGKRLKPAVSTMTSLGYDQRQILKDYSFNVEGYYKLLDDLFIYDQVNQPDSIRLDLNAEIGEYFRPGEGYSLGFETAVRKDEGPVTGGLSYSLGYSVVRDVGVGEAYYPKWHQAHGVKGDLGITWKGEDGLRPHRKRGRYFRSSSQVKFNTGLPYTDYIGYSPSHLQDQSPNAPAGGPNPEFQNNKNIIRGDRNASFVPYYFRWDIKPFDVGRENKWNFSWTILNVTNRENVFLYFFDRSKNPPERVTIPQFPFFPLLVSYEYQF